MVTDRLVQFSGLLDLSLSLLRKHRALKNDLTLVRGLDTLAIASSLVLTTKQKEVTKIIFVDSSRVASHYHITLDYRTLGPWNTGHQKTKILVVRYSIVCN